MNAITKAESSNGNDQEKNSRALTEYLLTRKMLCGLPHGVNAAPIFAPMPINVTGKICGKSHLLAIFKYSGIKVRAVMSLPKNIPEMIANKVNKIFSFCMLSAILVNL